MYNIPLSPLPDPFEWLPISVYTSQVECTYLERREKVAVERLRLMAINIWQACLKGLMVAGSTQLMIQATPARTAMLPTNLPPPHLTPLPLPAPPHPYLPHSPCHTCTFCLFHSFFRKVYEKR